MSFDAHQVRFLQRLVSERYAHRADGAISRHFCEHYSLGVHIGRHIEYRDEHHRMAEALLLAHDLPVQPRGLAATRAEAAVYGGQSEKSGSVAPHAGSVGIKCFGRCTLDSEVLLTPPGSYLVVTPELGQRIVCDRLLLVENLETFRRLEQYRWVDLEDRNVLAVFRGDREISTGDALAFVRNRTEPIWAFVDFDPDGLLMANTMRGRLERLILPDWPRLLQLANTARGRDLFDTQVSHARGTLDKAAHPAIREAWGVLCGRECGVTQERMELLDRLAPKK